MEEQQANEPESLTNTKNEGFEVIGADANLEADDWDTKKIGYLAARILSGVRARKEAGEGNAVPSPAVIAQASLGGREDVASNRNKGGSLDFGVVFPVQQAFSEPTNDPHHGKVHSADRMARKGLMLPRDL